MNRKYLPTFAELVDRMTICQLKAIFIPENKGPYDQEISDIKHDLNEIIKEKDIKLTGELLRATTLVMLTNRYIWENESKCRNGDAQSLELLKLTHSKELGERVDLKTDCLAAELKSDFQNWDIFE